ncbi:MAG: ABC transporter permease [Lachnospiraceae bacterium]|nr:ABC transporter permease [Lachnospiraceae bacterium]
MHVRNQKCIRHISFRNMKAGKTRNIVAILAISLTAILFTAIFTVAMSIVYGYEQSNFRKVGGYSHGTFKYLTSEQLEELQEDPLIQEWGVRRYLGMPGDAPFNKSQVEIGYADTNYAKWTFLEPVEGRLPKEGTNEAATDTTVLALLGVKPEIGAEFTMTFNVDGTETTETFTLCGYWEYDKITVANHVLLPESRVQEILDKTNCQCFDNITGRYSLDVMFQNAAHVEENLLTILSRHGYQSEDPAAKDTYIPIGVNWGYMNAQVSNYIDFSTIAAIALIIFLIMLTGYLIIYNVFQISVANDIRFYGLLKTIGTTGKQIRHMILLQAVFLSVIGIPVGLLIGYGIGALLTPIVLANLSVYQDALSVSPWIFIGSALFSLLTVIISCRRPGRIAAKVSPIEAVRYTEGDTIQRAGRCWKDRRMKANRRRTGKHSQADRCRKYRRHTGRIRKTENGASIFRMAWANLNRNRKKTTITAFSLSLSIVLLNITVTLTSGFDMDKYLSDITSDFIFANAGYFQTGAGRTFFSEAMGVSEEVIAELNAQSGVTDGGRTYGKYSVAQEFITEDYYRLSERRYYSESQVEERLANEEKENGLILKTVQLYGMEPFCLDKLTVYEGDLSKLYDGSGYDTGDTSADAADDIHYVAAVFMEDDYGNIEPDSHWAKVGDQITIRYIDEMEIYNIVTGEIYPDVESIPSIELPNVDIRLLKHRDIVYEVAALVHIPTAITYRYYGNNEFIMGADTFRQDTGTDSVLYYIFDVEDTAVDTMENYIADFTNNVVPQYDYESKQTYIEGFESEKRMFLLCGCVLSFIIGLIGILNFLNVILTNMITRRKEFAVLQSVGMTGRQLKKMLILEGELLTLGSVCFSLLLTVATAPLTADALSSMLWFFSYHFTVMPLLLVAPVFALLGVLVPLISYRHAAGKSIVERLREGT